MRKNKWEHGRSIKTGTKERRKDERGKGRGEKKEEGEENMQ